ncbi:MAG: NAAT family transporter [Azospirillaceae bacterium]|nr:NAAT family transporter [Azospirillaceae bacterium]
MENWSEYAHFFVSLFAILTPFAAIPMFLNLTALQTPAVRARTADTATMTVFVVLIGSAVSGDLVLRLMGTSLDSFRVGGGIVLLLIALSMLNAQLSAVKHVPTETTEAELRQSVGVVPLGLPLIAGPGSISTVIIEMQRGQGWSHDALIMACIAAVCATVWLSLRLAEPIGRHLGQTGLNILTRLFGLMLAAIAVEIMATGLRGLFPGFRG